MAYLFACSSSVSLSEFYSADRQHTQCHENGRRSQREGCCERQTGNGQLYKVTIKANDRPLRRLHSPDSTVALGIAHCSE